MRPEAKNQTASPSYFSSFLNYHPICKPNPVILSPLMASFYSEILSALFSFAIFRSSGEEGVRLLRSHTRSSLFKYFSCSQFLFLHFNFLWYSPFISVTQSSFPDSPPAYLSCSGLAENTYIIFAASVPTGERSTDCLDRKTSEGKTGKCFARQRTR